MFHNCMCKFMSFAMWRLVEVLTMITVLALIRLYSCVDSFILLAIWWLAKTFSTILVLIKLIYSCVGICSCVLAMWWLHVKHYYKTCTNKVLLLCENVHYAPCNVMNKLLFTILFARIMFHSCVGTVKALAIWWLWKKFITMLALIRFHSCVVMYMLLIATWWITQALATILALIRHFSCVD